MTALEPSKNPIITQNETAFGQAVIGLASEHKLSYARAVFLLGAVASKVMDRIAAKNPDAEPPEIIGLIIDHFMSGLGVNAVMVDNEADFADKLAEIHATPTLN